MTPLEKAEQALHRVLARLKGGEDMTTAEIMGPLERYVDEKIQLAFEGFARRVEQWAESK